MEVTVIVTTLWQAAAVVNSGLLLMAVMGLLFPAVLHYTHSEVHYGKSELALSRFSSCIMLVAYAFYLVFQLKGQNESYDRVNEVSSSSTHQFLTDRDQKCPHILADLHSIFGCQILFLTETHLYLQEQTLHQ
ncbi:hypothetical protein BHE74_00021668 [Ensete ventricosum]|nr:hypothetical protein BHE74_00021668 [Ensete ventricosum]RZR83505.1 hypothetical protein BHM03_00010121 [Ensete ventricosum]